MRLEIVRKLRKLFFDELKRVYYKEVKKNIEEVEESLGQMETQEFDDEA